jgi:predicted outer membrane protein
MRTLLASSFLVVAACSDSDVLDPADVAIADGETLGDTHAAQAEVDFAVDSDEVVAGKSAAIMMAIDDVQLLVADLALEVSTDPIVLDYADEILITRSEHLAATGDLVLGLGLSPIENPISDAIHLEAERHLRSLDLIPDNGFDFEFMRVEVTMHSEAVVLVSALADLAPFIDLQIFFDDAIGMIEIQRADAELILRGF